MVVCTRPTAQDSSKGTRTEAGNGEPHPPGARALTPVQLQKDGAIHSGKMAVGLCTKEDGESRLRPAAKKDFPGLLQTRAESGAALLSRMRSCWSQGAQVAPDSVEYGDGPLDEAVGHQSPALNWPAEK